MRTITLLLTVLVSQMPAAYIPSTVYVQRNPSKIIGVEQEKHNARTNDAHSTVEIPNIGDSQTLSTTGAAAEVPADLYDLTPAGKQATSAAPMRNCCIQGK